MQKLVSLIAGIALLALGLMFSVVLLVVLAVAGLAVWGYLWWKTREIRRVLRERPVHAGAGGRVFDGEATVVDPQGQAARIESGASSRRDD